MLRIVPHTVPRVGRPYEPFRDGFELLLLLAFVEGKAWWPCWLRSGKNASLSLSLTLSFSLSLSLSVFFLFLYLSLSLALSIAGRSGRGARRPHTGVTRN